MTNLTVYLLKVANLRTVDRPLRYPGNCEARPWPEVAIAAGLMNFPLLRTVFLVGRCRLTVSKTEMKAPIVPALETTIW